VRNSGNIFPFISEKTNPRSLRRSMHLGSDLPWRSCQWKGSRRLSLLCQDERMELWLSGRQGRRRMLRLCRSEGRRRPAVNVHSIRAWCKRPLCRGGGRGIVSTFGNHRSRRRWAHRFSPLSLFLDLLCHFLQFPLSLLDAAQEVILDHDGSLRLHVGRNRNVVLSEMRNVFGEVILLRNRPVACGRLYSGPRFLFRGPHWTAVREGGARHVSISIWHERSVFSSGIM
jgi:hypothetical protein